MQLILLTPVSLKLKLNEEKKTGTRSRVSLKGPQKLLPQNVAELK